MQEVKQYRKFTIDELKVLRRAELSKQDYDEEYLDYLDEQIKEAPKTVDEGIEESKAGIWACLVWVNKDKEKTDKIFRDLYSWLDMHYNRSKEGEWLMTQTKLEDVMKWVWKNGDWGNFRKSKNYVVTRLQFKSKLQGYKVTWKFKEIIVKIYPSIRLIGE